MTPDRPFDALEAYRLSTRYRRFEEEVGAAVATREIHGEMHLGIGQEAIAAALAFHLRDGDGVVSTHRAHLHALAAGVEPVSMLGEILERDGLCHGKGGHMHLFSPERKFMCTGIVGAGAPIAAGYALAMRRGVPGPVTVAIAGDGSMNQGALLETLNLAALWKLPLIFLCEDNGYGISVPRDRATAGTLAGRGEAFGIPGTECDGTDPEQVYRALEPAFARARSGEGPSAVVARCYRYRGHYEGDADTYRPAAEKQEATHPLRDPLHKLRARLEDDGTDPATLDEIESDAEKQVGSWFAAARRLPFPLLEDVGKDVYA